MYGKILLCYYFAQEKFGMQFLPAGSTPQWEGGVVSALFVLQIRVQCYLHFFSGDAQECFLLMYARVHTCACVCCIVSTQVCLP